MAIAHLAQEWSRKHTLHLDGIESTSVFTGPLKWMLGWVEIARLADPGACCDAVGRERALIFYHGLVFISTRSITRLKTHHVEDMVGTQKREEGGNSNFFFC
jgi:hypothetical protein